MTISHTLTHRLDRRVEIRADRDTVFRYFTDTARWARWWGPGSAIDPRPGGRMLIRYPDGTEAAGEVVEVAPPDRISFTYGYVKGEPIPPGASLVTIELQPSGASTVVTLTHDFAEPAARDHHLQGWRYQLSRFANAVADERFADAPALVDRWFQAWSDPDDTAREAALRSIAADDVQLRDQFSAVAGLPDLIAHIAAAQRFMPGVRMERTGEPRQCQGTVVVDWKVTMPAGRPPASGTNVFTLDGNGRILSVTGLWG